MSSSSARISVIIPVKNRADLLVLTLDNLLAQTLQPYELIVVDDNSNDRLPEVIQQYKEKVVFLKNKGHGPGAGRNTGIQIATGNYIQFFDSDDLMTLNKLEVQSNLLQKNSAGMVVSPEIPASYIDGQWQMVDAIKQYSPLPPSLSFTDCILRGWNITTQSCMFSADLIKDVGAWNEEVFTHEDYWYLFNVSLLIDKPLHTNQCAVFYRQHTAQLTDNHTKTNQRAENYAKVMRWIEDSLTHKKIKADFLSKQIFSVRLAEACNSVHDTSKKVSKLHNIMWRVHQKMGRMQTQTNWQPIHGVTTDTNIFEAYLKLLTK
jgi:glycosyltransferase involved in cell wall biosynthesis